MTVREAEETIRFGVFEFDQANQRLLKNGFVVRLGQQPTQVLSALLERPGEIVSREELRQRLWGSDVFVDFDHGLNKSVQKLRDALNDSASTPLYIETVPRVGYRFIAPLDSTLQPAPAIPSPQNAAVSPPEAPEPPRFTGKVTAALIGGSILLVAMLAWGLLHVRQAPSQPIRALAVLPLDNVSGDPAQDYFADGTTDELITALARVPNLRIVSRNSAMQNKGTRKPLQQLAAELNVDAIVEGSVIRSGDRVRINAQFVDARNDRHLWAQSFEGSAGDAIALEDQVAEAIVSRARLAAAPIPTDAKNVPAAAHDAYLRGRYFYDRRDSIRSAQFFQQAIDLDPGYASAYAGLSAALASQALLLKAPASQVMPQAMQVARKAIALDPDNSEAYTALGSIEVQYSWDWPDAERNLRRALELNPSNSLAHWAYALYLDSFGRTAEAVDQMRRAVEIDPLSFYMVRNYATTLYYARRYDEALEQLQRAGEMQPGSVNVVDNWISRAYEMKQMYPQAVEHDLIVMQSYSSQPNLQALRTMYQQQGWQGYWRARLAAEQSSAALEVAASRPCEYYDLGVMQLRVGQIDQAFESLHNAAVQRCFWMGAIKVEPLLDPLRNDPRFRDLLQQVNLATP